ncbi:MAG: LacI family DNA-binding transcriptional regulator [Alphaproteobacteria bacterium]
MKSIPQAPSRRRPTIRAVADLAGVSQTTVSFVINDKPGAAISEATRRRVWDAVEELDYRPNHAARVLSTRKSNLIGFISDRIASGAYGGQSVLGAQSVAWSKGRLLLIVDTDADEAIEEAAIDQLMRRQVDGMLVGAFSLRAWRPPAMLLELPTVLINCFDPDGRFPCVIADEYEGGRSVAAHLVAAGHRRIGLVYGEPEAEAGVRRRDGFRDGLERAGLGDNRALEVTTNWFPDGGRHGIAELLDRDDPPTAVFCISDWVAMGAYQEIQRRGLRIPDDIAVVGYDDQEFAAGLQPPLTTLALPHAQIGRRAAEMLLAHRGDRPLPPETVKVACPLVRRDSA